MSERVRLTSASQIHKGDLVRVEFGAKEYKPMTAFEYVASADGDCLGWDIWFGPELSAAGRSVWLLERKVVLPDSPYSLVVPPVYDQNVMIPRVLQYRRGGRLAWFNGASEVDPKNVEGLVRSGWRIIPGQPVTEENNIEENTK